MRRQTGRNSSSSRHRDGFDKKTTADLARRSAFQCVMCSAVTVAASAESATAVINIGVAAHIAAASPDGPRYDASMTPKQRSSIENAIWLCQNDAKAIDDDVVEWPTPRLHDIKRDHERTIRSKLGMPRNAAWLAPAVLGPMLQDQNLGEDNEVGILMVGSSTDDLRFADREPPWTLFVKPVWLKWVVQGQSAGFGVRGEVPSDQIYGQIPAWPDGFFDFLSAIIMTGKTFAWQRSRKGFMVLSQL
ncbi:hypothetical protein [Agrobacterium tumefaciens]|uniref:hypothetical protein n=1 Tax=Agrobacterium tumefaciens TaxID=358 RepID=UPI000DE197BC|nr:hypothetical protein [Agrobacterium tumefaciens]MDP9791021.1 hypothetical protein [Agrobacterium tumefaciens]